MEILGIGAPELAFIVIIALIVLGPKDMQKAGRTIGRWLNDLVHSEGWRVFQKTSRELRNLPSSLMREANYELIKTDEALRKSLEAGSPPMAGQAQSGSLSLEDANHTIQPPGDPADEHEPDA